MSIHNTAVIEKGVEIGSGVSVGEYSVIYSGTTIKDNVKIGSHCSIGSEPEIINNELQSELIINENTTINSFVSINLGTRTNTEIGKDCFIMNHSYIAHDTLIGDGSLIASGVKISGSVNIGKEVYLGANSSVHQNSKLDDLCLLGANSFAKGSLLKGLIYAGVPAIPKKINIVGIERSKLGKEYLDRLLVEAKKNLIS